MYRVLKVDGPHIYTDKGVVSLCALPKSHHDGDPVDSVTWQDMRDLFVTALTSGQASTSTPPSAAPLEDDDAQIEAWRDGRVRGALSDLPHEVSAVAMLAGVTIRVAEDSLKRLCKAGLAVQEENGRWRVPTRIEDEVNRVEKEVEPMLSERPVQLNVLVSRTGAKLSVVTHALLRLELAGKAYRLPGDRYTKARPSSEQTIPMTQGERREDSRDRDAD